MRRNHLLGLGLGFMLAAGIAAALGGVWWAAAADFLIALLIIAASYRHERRWRAGWWRHSNGHREL